MAYSLVLCGHYEKTKVPPPRNLATPPHYYGLIRSSYSYFEGAYDESDLVLFGYNRDGKRRHEQMVIALACNEEGCPVGVEVFPGNTQDASTVPAKIAHIQNDYGVKEILFVGDRGMMTQANAEKVRGIEGLNTISALTHRQIVELLRRKVITPELFDEKRILEVINPEDPSRRYELCRNPWTAQRVNGLEKLPKNGLRKIPTFVALENSPGVRP